MGESIPESVAALSALLAPRLLPSSLREVLVAYVRGVCTRQVLSEWLALVSAQDEFRRLSSVDLQMRVQRLLSPFGMTAALGKFRVSPAEDANKGGWTSIESRRRPCNGDLPTYLFIGPSEIAVARARDLDEVGEHGELAQMLGIPSCCAAFFSQLWSVALQHQGDLLTYTAAFSESSSYPWDNRTNIATQYFGYAPISFYPCSFTCRAAAEVGQLAFDILDAACQKDLGHRFRSISRSAVLYTEHDGVALIEEPDWKDGTLSWLKGQLRFSSHVCRVSALLSTTNQLYVESPHSVFTIVEGSRQRLEGPDVACCIF